MISQEAEPEAKASVLFSEQNLRKLEKRTGQDSVKGMLTPLSLHLRNAHKLLFCVDVQLCEDVLPGHKAVLLGLLPEVSCPAAVGQ